MAIEEKTMLSTALREIRKLSHIVKELNDKVACLSARSTRRISITEYSRETGMSQYCVRARISSGILNAEKIGGKYFIILPA